jgi:hypothetical protein
MRRPPRRFHQIDRFRLNAIVSTTASTTISTVITPHHSIGRQTQGQSGFIEYYVIYMFLPQIGVCEPNTYSQQHAHPHSGARAAVSYMKHLSNDCDAPWSTASIMYLARKAQFGCESISLHKLTTVRARQALRRVQGARDSLCWGANSRLRSCIAHGILNAVDEWNGRTKVLVAAFRLGLVANVKYCSGVPRRRCASYAN